MSGSCVDRSSRRRSLNSDVQNHRFLATFAAWFLDPALSFKLPTLTGFQASMRGPKSGQDTWADFDALSLNDLLRLGSLSFCAHCHRTLVMAITAMAGTRTYIGVQEKEGRHAKQHVQRKVFYSMRMGACLISSPSVEMHAGWAEAQ